MIKTIFQISLFIWLEHCQINKIVAALIQADVLPALFTFYSFYITVGKYLVGYVPIEGGEFFIFQSVGCLLTSKLQLLD